MEFVYDRTKTDVLLGTKKGSYSAEDLNRVESAVQELVELAKQVGVKKQFFTKTDWGLPGKFTPEQWPTKKQMIRYLNNVKSLCSEIEVEARIPSTVEHLTWDGANQIEKALFLVYDRIVRIIKIFRYSGEIFSGEENYL